MSRYLMNEAIQLRAVEPEDLEVLYKWENDTDVWQYGASISPYSKFILKQYIANAQTDIFESKQLRFMITVIANNITIGTIDMYDFNALDGRCGIGVYIDPQYRQRGLAGQALALLQNYAFNFLMMNQLYALIPANNMESLKLFKRAGFSQSGTLSQWILHDSKYVDAIIVQKLKND